MQILKTLTLLPLAIGIPIAWAQGLQNEYVPADKTPWYRESPQIPVQLAALWGDRAKGEAGTLLTAPGGFKRGAHSHTADYRAIVVRGTWKHWVPSTGEGSNATLQPGAYWTQVHTQLHEDACVSKTPCVIFLFNKESYITEFPVAK